MNFPTTIQAYYSQTANTNTSGTVQTLPFSVLPNNEVTIAVQFSSLNYKDALSSRGLNAVTRHYPHIPGIDAAGVVLEDTSNTYTTGQQVLVTGYDMGTNTYGGFSSHIRVPASWVVPLPHSLNLHQSMMIGTAGFTAIYGIIRLKREGIIPYSGPILVTGGTGGVGSFAIFALSQLGYTVVAATRNKANNDFLIELGATEIVNSNDLLAEPPKPLLAGKYAGAIETVGGKLLDVVLRQTSPKGAVASCGNVLGIALSTNVLPFILRGISLLGIDSASCVRPIREQVWEIASRLDFSTLPKSYSRTIPLEHANAEIDKMLEGKNTGRVVFSTS